MSEDDLAPTPPELQEDSDSDGMYDYDPGSYSLSSEDEYEDVRFLVLNFVLEVISEDTYSCMFIMMLSLKYPCRKKNESYFL